MNTLPHIQITAKAVLFRACIPRARRVAVSIGALAVAASAGAQHFNIDMDVSGISPSSSFGAAANQPGYWNQIYAPNLTPLSNLAGVPTGVTMTITDNLGIGYGYGNVNFAGNTGDYAALLNDFFDTDTLVQGGDYTCTFSGLAPGKYRIYTYGAFPFNSPSYTPVYVVNSVSVNPQFVTGPMPGNSFAYGITHVYHDVTVSNNGLLEVLFQTPPNQTDPGVVNGFQIVPAPGASALFALSGLLAAKRRRPGPARNDHP